MAVGLSFVFLAITQTPHERSGGPRPIHRVPRSVRLLLRDTGLLAWVWIVAQTLVGGTSDADVASLFLWDYGWVALAIVSAVIGPIWSWIRPLQHAVRPGRAGGSMGRTPRRLHDALSARAVAHRVARTRWGLASAGRLHDHPHGHDHGRRPVHGRGGHGRRPGAGGPGVSRRTLSAYSARRRPAHGHRAVGPAPAGMGPVRLRVLRTPAMVAGQCGVEHPAGGGGGWARGRSVGWAHGGRTVRAVPSRRAAATGAHHDRAHDRHPLVARSGPGHRRRGRPAGRHSIAPRIALHDLPRIEGAP